MKAQRDDEEKGQENVPTLVRSADHSEATERVLKIYHDGLKATKNMLFGHLKEVVLY